MIKNPSHVVPEEDVVPLVVEGDRPLPLELRLVVEQRRQHPGHSVAEARREVVQNDLGTERGDLAPVFLQRKSSSMETMQSIKFCAFVINSHLDLFCNLDVG